MERRGERLRRPDAFGGLTRRDLGLAIALRPAGHGEPAWSLEHSEMSFWSRRDLERKVRQFPPGTTFKFSLDWGEDEAAARAARARIDAWLRARGYALASEARQ